MLRMFGALARIRSRS